MDIKPYINQRKILLHHTSQHPIVQLTLSEMVMGKYNLINKTVVGTGKPIGSVGENSIYI